jgi:hypothetical protein
MHKTQWLISAFCGKSTKSAKPVEKGDFCDNHGLLEA